METQPASQEQCATCRSALALALTAAAAPSARATPPGIEITASAAPAEIAIGGSSSVVGSVRVAGHGLAGEALALQSAAYPSHSFVTVAHGMSGPDGSFAFTAIEPDRNARLRVVT